MQNQLFMLLKLFSNLKIKNGYSLIELLIALGITSIISAATISLINYQNKEIKNINDQIEVQTLTLQLYQVLANENHCKCLFSSHNFNYDTSSWISLPTVIPKTFDIPSCTPLSTLISSGANISPQSNIKIESISTQNLIETVTGKGVFKTTLSINFDQSTLSRKNIRNIQIPMLFALDMTDPSNNRGIFSCSTGMKMGQQSALCQVCIQCGHHDEEGGYSWNDGAISCINTNMGYTSWSSISTSGDEETGGVRCRTSLTCL
ncbi:MAG: prepilin-type N-terminal cleavage/methylation domain-containing protein [Pseudobdellovibrio sp.]